MSGASAPGAPSIAVGRTNDLVWGFTNSYVDTSDIWREKLSEDKSEYLVENEWRRLEIITEKIKVKGVEESTDFEVKMTHRGPVISFAEFKSNYEKLFGRHFA